MNLLSVEGLSKTYGTKVLFENINFGINEGDKVALVAKNGTGKTTLINILKGLEIGDAGKVVFKKELTISFLDQEPILPQNETIIDFFLNDDSETNKIIKRYEHALEATNKPDAGDKAFNELDEAMELMNQFNAWDFEHQIHHLLGKLGITKTDQLISSLSGGQKKRVALCKVLYDKPDLVIMDEPTNHLDIEMIEWLEGYLSSQNLSCLVVTHDRYFLDNVCNRILEIENGSLYPYAGNFSYYLEKKAERDAQQQSELEKARNLYKRELEWVRRQPKARTTKSKSRVDAFEDIKKAAAKKLEQKALDLTVKMNRMGGTILEAHKISKSFGDKVLFNNFSYNFKKGEKIGISGKNGSGKSTIINILLKKLEPDTGKINVGETIVFGYYSQSGLQFEDGKRVIEVVKDFGTQIPMADGTHISASQLLTRFHFPPDMQFMHVNKLSGGEKRRLYLMTILIQNPNFLILDEPTNDLDIITLQTLEVFLQDFPGCVLIVTHDRYFMDKIVDHIFAFEGNGEIKDFPGNYSEYREWRELQDEKEEDVLSIQKENKKEKDNNDAKLVEKAKGEKLSFKEKYEYDGLENEIAALEDEKVELEKELLTTTDFDALSKKSARISELIALIDAKSLRWLELGERV
jgi:ABC transport system ATP-binding/permease protein